MGEWKVRAGESRSGEKLLVMARDCWGEARRLLACLGVDNCPGFSDSFIPAVKLSDYARKQGVSYLTAWRWFKSGKFPVPARQLPSGTILVEEPLPEGRTVRKICFA